MNEFINPFFVSTQIKEDLKGGNVTPLGTAPLYRMTEVPSILSPVSPVLSPVSSIISPLSPVLSPRNTLILPEKYQKQKYNLGKINNPSNKKTKSSSKDNYEVMLSSPAYVSPMIHNPFSPAVSVNEYTNVNSDPELLKKVTKYFYKKTMNKWIYSDFVRILSYLTIKNNEVQIVKNLNVNNKEDTDMRVINKKVDFIREYVFSIYDMRSFIKKYAIKSGLDLWKLKKYKKYVKKSLFKQIKKRLKKMM